MIYTVVVGEPGASDLYVEAPDEASAGSAAEQRGATVKLVYPRRCCFVHPEPRGSCAAPAEFQILTTRGYDRMAGPDPYSDETDSCETHVGALLSWQPEATDTHEIQWTVRQLLPTPAAVER